MKSSIIEVLRSMAEITQLNWNFNSNKNADAFERAWQNINWTKI